jgi:hypothetical protein
VTCFWVGNVCVFIQNVCGVDAVGVLGSVVVFVDCVRLVPLCELEFCKWCVWCVFPLT